MNTRPIRGYCNKSNRSRSLARGQYAIRGQNVYFPTEQGFLDWSHLYLPRPAPPNPRAQGLSQVLMESATRGWFQQLDDPVPLPGHQRGAYGGYPAGQGFGRGNQPHFQGNWFNQYRAESQFGTPYQRSGIEGRQANGRFEQQPQPPPFPFFHGSLHEESESYWNNLKWGVEGPRDGPSGQPGFPRSAAGMEEGSMFPAGPCLNLYPPTNLKRYELFEKAWMCGETPDTRQYLAIYWLHFGEETEDLPSPLFENDRNHHAEAHMLKHMLLLLSAVSRDKLRAITIMQNSSPCRKCADAYRQAREHLSKESSVQVSIVFSSFHWVKRPSCQDAGHKHTPVDSDKHRQNTEGLRALREAGFVVRTTCHDDWQRLRRALQVPLPINISTKRNYSISPRGIADVNMSKDLEKTLAAD